MLTEYYSPSLVLSFDIPFFHLKGCSVVSKCLEVTLYTVTFSIAHFTNFRKLHFT